MELQSRPIACFFSVQMEVSERFQQGFPALYANSKMCLFFQTSEFLAYTVVGS